MPFQRNFFVAHLHVRMLLSATLMLAGTAASAQLGALDLNGNPIDLGQTAPGKMNVLIFVRTDCPISNRYAPTLQKLSSTYAEKARFWLVYPDNGESKAAIERHVRDYNYEGFSPVRDPQHALVKLSRAQITPEAAVFDANSHLLYHGRIDNWYQSFGHKRPQATTHELDDAIRAALEGKSVTVPETKAIGCYISDVQ